MGSLRFSFVLVLRVGEEVGRKARCSRSRGSIGEVWEAGHSRGRCGKGPRGLYVQAFKNGQHKGVRTIRGGRQVIGPCIQ